jgi:high affinity Mn2+ porin
MNKASEQRGKNYSGIPVAFMHMTIRLRARASFSSCYFRLTGNRQTRTMERVRAFVLVLLLSLADPALAQDTAVPAQLSNENNSFWNRLWVSGQANFIRQQHGSFPAAYSGPNSLLPTPEHATSYVLTLYTGFQITKDLEILADVEATGGAGLSNALGLAGFTNLDVVRNPYLSTAPYLARGMLHYVLPLSDSSTEATRNPLSLFPTLPVRRLEFRVGKMSAADFFDVNAVGSDSHLQFMNWTTVNNGAWDYAADTRGYTYGLYMEYDDRWGCSRGRCRSSSCRPSAWSPDRW